ncbi:hypothetical protein D9615_003409 [Tricholomella constricta]|uniref:Uncharacterized protein n=1 Tax=Tricholomella constricta TaxID=117010 RepID=A0A8H5M8A4_9AGAR|nr:hypothetical protein D9615_003409 [Tricholomella constricta]
MSWLANFSPNELNESPRPSDAVLATLSKAANVAPVPYLQEAAALALLITEIAQALIELHALEKNVKNNKRAFRNLARDASSLVYILLFNDKTLVRSKVDNSPPLAHLEFAKQDLATVCQNTLCTLRKATDMQTLREIYGFAKEHLSQTMIVRTFRRRADARQIRGYLKRLKDSVRFLILVSNVTLQESLKTVQESLDELTTRESDMTVVHSGEHSSAHESKGERMRRQTERHGEDEDPTGADLLPGLREMHGTLTSVGNDQNTYMGSLVHNDSGDNCSTTQSLNLVYHCQPRSRYSLSFSMCAQVANKKDGYAIMMYLPMTRIEVTPNFCGAKVYLPAVLTQNGIATHRWRCKSPAISPSACNSGQTRAAATFTTMSTADGPEAQDRLFETGSQKQNPLEHVPDTLVRSTLRLQFPPTYVIVGVYRLFTDKLLYVPAWDKCRHGTRRGTIVGTIWAVLTFSLQRKFIEIFLANSPRVTGLSNETIFGYTVPFSLPTYAAVLLLGSQITYILRFFLSRNIRIARDRAWTQTVASRGKGPEFWQPYVEEWDVPPLVQAEPAWERFVKRYLGGWVVILLPFNFYPFVGVLVAAAFKSLRTAHNLHRPYFESKKMNDKQMAIFMEERKWDYRRMFHPFVTILFPPSITQLRPLALILCAPIVICSYTSFTPRINYSSFSVFGFAAALLEGMPIIGLAFTISNRVGAAMWAHDLEKRQHFVAAERQKRTSADRI